MRNRARTIEVLQTVNENAVGPIIKRYCDRIVRGLLERPTSDQDKEGYHSAAIRAASLTDSPELKSLLTDAAIHIHWDYY